MKKILHWSSWSVVCKTQFIAAGFGFFATILVDVLGTLPVWPERSMCSGIQAPVADFMFGLWMLLAAPTVIVMRGTGIPEGHWWAFAIEAAVNTVLCLFLGTLLGLIFKLLSRRTKRYVDAA